MNYVQENHDDHNSHHGIQGKKDRKIVSEFKNACVEEDVNRNKENRFNPRDKINVSAVRGNVIPYE